MLTWDSFYLFAVGTILLSAVGAAAAVEPSESCAVADGGRHSRDGMVHRRPVDFSSRPPLRTMGETPLVFFFLIIAGLLTYHRWHFRWILSFTTIMAVFCIIISNRNCTTKA